MDNEKVATETIETNQVEVVTPNKVEVKTFTQEQLDQVVKDRLTREREAFAKSVGLETYSKEVVESTINTLRDESKTLKEKEQTYVSTIEKKEQELLGYKKGIVDGKLDEALMLAKVKQQKNEGMSLEDALTLTVDEYPTLRGTPQKQGMEVGNNVTPPDNPYLTPKLTAKYAWLNKK